MPSSMAALTGGIRPRSVRGDHSRRSPTTLPRPVRQDLQLCLSLFRSDRDGRGRLPTGAPARALRVAGERLGYRARGVDRPIGRQQRATEGYEHRHSESLIRSRRQRHVDEDSSMFRRSQSSSASPNGSSVGSSPRIECRSSRSANSSASTHARSTDGSTNAVGKRRATSRSRVARQPQQARRA